MFQSIAFLFLAYRYLLQSIKHSESLISYWR
jgi:hypothetical protein